MILSWTHLMEVGQHVTTEVLDRRWVGIELSENYCEIAKQRIQSFVDQKKQQKLEFENGGQ